MTTRNISAAFDSQADAESAGLQLASIGVAGDEIHILEQKTRHLPSDLSVRADPGWWTVVRGLFGSSQDRAAHQRSSAASTFVLTASVDETLAVAVVFALESSNALELDVHQKYWRKNKWRGSAAAHVNISYKR